VLVTGDGEAGGGEALAKVGGVFFYALSEVGGFAEEGEGGEGGCDDGWGDGV